MNPEAPIIIALFAMFNAIVAISIIVGYTKAKEDNRKVYFNVPALCFWEFVIIMASYFLSKPVYKYLM